MELGLSQNKFAELLGITQPTMAKIEMGLLNNKKYHEALTKALKQWKTKKIKELKEEIDFIEKYWN